MAFVFDPLTDAADLAKHRVSLSRAADLQVRARVADRRCAKLRLRAYGLLDGGIYCLAYALRGDDMRAISLRRAHAKEYRRYVR